MLQSNIQKIICAGIRIYKKWNLTMISAKNSFVNMIQKWANFLTSEAQQERKLNILVNLEKVVSNYSFGSSLKWLQRHFIQCWPNIRVDLENQLQCHDSTALALQVSFPEVKY